MTCIVNYLFSFNASAGLEKAFNREGLCFDYVVNCAGETRHGMGESVYYEGIVTLSSSCAKIAATFKVKRFIEISSGCIMSDAEVIDAFWIFSSLDFSYVNFLLI